ncbi:F-box/FBD/LRR-repeat protein At1g13570 [Linum grandiflorum]
MEHSSVDRISSLPNDVRELILMSLPLRDAAKCSILSTTWRNLWTYLPTLVIDETFGDAIKPRRSNDYRSDVVERLIMLDVCKVLMIHRGPLKDLSLSIGMLGDQVDQVLRFLPIKTIENLTIVSDPFTDFSKTVLESFSQLKTLRLSSCTFPFSTVSFEGFDRLTVLQLRNISFDGTAQPQLIFRCPLLTTLIVERFLSLIDPSILVEAPRLECLYLFSHFSHLVLNGTSLLKTLTVHKILSETSSIQLGEVFGTVETLSIGICIISEYISHREQWMKLRQLSLVEIEDRDLHTRNNVLAVVRMIMNSPNLQRLEIQVSIFGCYLLRPLNCAF